MPVFSRPTKVREVSIATPAKEMDIRTVRSEAAQWQLPTVALVVCIARLDVPGGGTMPHEHVTVALDADVLDAIARARETLPEVVIGG